MKNIIIVLRQHGVLALIVVLAAVLRFYHLGQGGLGCPSSSGNVRSMMHSGWHFFFIAWDAAGTYMQDKPPLAYWLQTLSALLLGYGGTALMLPQAIAGCLSVVFLYRLILHWREDKTLALTAALLLAVFPVSVLTSRTAKVDEHIVTLVLATGCLLVAYGKSGKFRTLLFAALAGGLAFNVKGLALIIMMPSLFILLLSAHVRQAASTVGRLIVAGVLFIVVAFAWLVAVDLTPETMRPRVMNTENNRMMELLMGHNGIGRLSETKGFNPANAMHGDGTAAIPVGILYGGPRGWGRIVNEFPSGMMRYLFPLVGIGFVLMLADVRQPSRRVWSAFWLIWMILGLCAFCLSRLGSTHYLEALAPPLVVITGFTLVSAIRESGWRQTLSIAGIMLTASWIIADYRTFAFTGPYLTLIASFVLLCLFLHLIFRNIAAHVLPIQWLTIAAIGTIAIPLVISATCVFARPYEGTIPGASFLELKRLGEGHPSHSAQRKDYPSGDIDIAAPALHYLLAQPMQTRYLVVAPSFIVSSMISAEYDRPTLPLFNEYLYRPEISAETLQQLVQRGDVRYMLIPRTWVNRQITEIKKMIAEANDITEVCGLPTDSLWRLLDLSEPPHE